MARLMLAAAAMALSAVLAMEDQVIVTINPDGGMQRGVDGIKFVYGYGMFQLIRDGRGYAYWDTSIQPDDIGGPNNDGAQNPDGYFMLAVGSTVVWPAGAYDTYLAHAAPGITAITFEFAETENLEDGVSFASTLTTPEINSLRYTVAVEGHYAFPADYIHLDFNVTIPEGNEENVILYLFADSFIGGLDGGVGTSMGDYAVGTMASVGTADQSGMGFVYTGGAPWTGQQSEYFACNMLQDETPGVNDIPDVLDGCFDASVEGQGPAYATDFSHSIVRQDLEDDSFGVSINFGSTPGSYTTNAVLYVTDTPLIGKLIKHAQNIQIFIPLRPWASIISLWVGFAFFLATTLWALFKVWLRARSISTTIIVAINAITALAYLIMATTDTSIGSFCDGRSFEWIRYAAWALVAPLTTSLLASIARAHVADVVVTGLAAFISLAALFAGALTPSCTGVWPLLAFAVASGFVVIIQFTRSYRAAALAHLPEDVAKLFCFYLRTLAFAMIGYALVWGVSEGGRNASDSQEIIAYTVLDILTKVIVNAVLLLGIDSYHKYGTSFAWLGGQNLDFELTPTQA